MGIILYGQVSFSLAQAKLLSGFFAPTSPISFLGPYLLFFAKTFQAERAEPTRGEKQSESATLQ